MHKCHISIFSAVDGKPTKTKLIGLLDLRSDPYVLSYRDGVSEVCLTFGETVVIERRGDYGLYLPLVKGEKTEGILRFGEKEELISVLTENFRISTDQTGLKFKAEYGLDFGEFVQNMRLYLVAKI